MKKFFTSIFIIVFFSSSVLSQVVINEVASRGVFLDENQSKTDWIELYNTAAQQISLNNYHLTDNINNLYKWALPDITIMPQQFLMIFASGENRVSIVDHWETAIEHTSLWAYFLGTSSPPNNWNTNGFSDASWQVGQGGIGYGDGDDNTVIASTNSVYLRKEFTITDLGGIELGVLHMDYDDGFIAYINGVEIARSASMGAVVNPSNTYSAQSHEALIYQGGAPEEYLINSELLDSVLIQGQNILAIQVHNAGITSSDLTAMATLSFGINNSGNYFSNTLSPYVANTSTQIMHTNFQLNSEGEEVILTNDLGNIEDQLTFGYIQQDHSYGRSPDGAFSFCLFASPSPGFSNSNSLCYSGYEDPPKFSIDAGFYSGQQTVSINTASNSAVIKVTTDGSFPTATSSTYSSPIIIDTTTVVSATCYSTSNLLPSQKVINVYLIDEYDIELPVISISTAPYNLWDNDSGIYVLGDSYDANYPYFGSNFWEPWSKHSHIEFFDKQRTQQFEKDFDLEIHGGWSRAEPQKSFRVDFKSEYDGALEYPIITAKPNVTKYNNFNLRNGGQHVNDTKIQDAIFQRTVKNTHIDRMEYEPCVVFLNGAYWGVYGIREKLDEHYVESNYGVNSNSIDLLNPVSVLSGSDVEFLNMYDYIINTSATDVDFYNNVTTMLDIENYIDYFITEIHVQNVDFINDWWTNNLKIWREQSPGSKWRYMLYDTDAGGGYWGQSPYENYIDLVRNPLFNQTPHSDIFDKLLYNPQIKSLFINRFADLINTIFQGNNMQDVGIAMKDSIANDMPRHINFWNAPITQNHWLNSLQSLLNHMTTRVEGSRQNINSSFSLNGQVSVTIDVSPPEAGIIKISTIIPENLPWTGVYFNGNPVAIEAIPNVGYSFDYWLPNGNLLLPDSSQQITLNISNSDVFTAMFSSLSYDLVITEICYNQDSTLNSDDWFELRNNSSTDINLSNWLIEDENQNQYYIPNNTIIQSNEFLVLCQDMVKFNNIYPNVSNVIGNFDFGLGNAGDQINLYDNNGGYVLSVSYTDSLPWPAGADGYGRTLEFDMSTVLNNNPDNWFVGCMLGSPGVAYTNCNPQLSFREINYNSSGLFPCGDWLEISNNTFATIDLSNYVLRDGSQNNYYVIPPNTTLEYNDHIVAYRDDVFLNYFDCVENKVGPFNFGLANSGEAIRLYNSSGKLVYSVVYDDQAPWPTQADGDGETLEIEDVTIDVNNGANWVSDCVYGTPGTMLNTQCEYCSDLTTENPMEKIQLNIYPNPANNVLSLETNMPLPLKVFLKIFNIQGQEVLSTRHFESSSKTIEIDVSSLKTGAYLLEVNLNHQQQVFKINILH